MIQYLELPSTDIGKTVYRRVLGRHVRNFYFGYVKFEMPIRHLRRGVK